MASNYGLLCIFCFLRPIFSISTFVRYDIAGVTLNEMFGIGSSYLFLILFIINIRKIRFDFIAVNIFFLCAYILGSVFWGAGLQEVVRLVLPFTVFFVARSTITDERKFRNIILCLVLGFIVPVISSAVITLQGLGINQVIFKTGITRYMGVYSHTHPLAHSMFICLFILFLYNSMYKNKTKFMTLAIAAIGIMAFYNIYKSYTRTVYVGLAVFLLVYLWGRRKYHLLAVSAVVMVLIVALSSTFQVIFFDIVDPIAGRTNTFKEMGSGRLGGWEEMFRHFVNAPPEIQIRGLGMGDQTTITSGADFGGAHNDFLAMLLIFGFIGLAIYLTYNGALLVNILFSRLDRNLRSAAFGFVASVIAMNLLSNSYLTRFELGQYFNLIMGMFFGLSEATPAKETVSGT